MLKELLRPEIEFLIQERRWKELNEALETWPSPEVADLLLDIEKTFRVLLFRALPKETQTAVFTYLEIEQRHELIFDLTDQEMKHLLADMPPDDRTFLLEELPAKVTRTLMNLLSQDDLAESRSLLGYPEDSVGRHMTPDFVILKPEWTVNQAIEHLRQYGKDRETIYRLYVINQHGKLLDDILLKNLILADENEKISNLMEYNVVSLSAFAHQSEAVSMMEKYDVYALPVVDSDGLLVGIVTFDDVFDISEEEATEDFQKIGAINPVDQSYLSASVWKLFIKRMPWLLALLLANFITSGIISQYSEITLAVVALASFLPMLIGTAGNSGTQSATLIVRGLATREVEILDWLKILKKEIFVGILLGVFLASLAFFRGYIEGEAGVQIAIVVSLSMVTLILWANILGAMLPIILGKLKLDPAVISSPLVATLIDASGIIIYFNIALAVFAK